MDKNIVSLGDLLEEGLISEASHELAEVVEHYPVLISPAVASSIGKGDEADPVALQYVPSVLENVRVEGELDDPIGDETASPLPGLVHRYPDRVLIKVTGACRVLCRFCFRRELLRKEPDGALTEEAWDKIIAYLEAHPEVSEAILSGGDPFVLSDRRLQSIFARLHAVPSLRVLRVHTRVPVADPERMTENLVKVIKGRLPVYVLLHCNHAQELTKEAREACARLVDNGIPVLSQSVLLRGVNDSFDALEALMRAFVEARVIPHYMHIPDLAPGTAHFRVPLSRARSLLAKLHGRLSGLCVPRLILEIPGGAGKIDAEGDAAKQEGSKWVLEDFKGELHDYLER